MNANYRPPYHLTAYLLIGVAMSACLASCNHAPPPKPLVPVYIRAWSDAEILAYVLQLGDPTRGWSMPRKTVLGQHHGLNLLQTVSCGDYIGHGNCSRVIHYEANESECARGQGVMKDLSVYAQDHSERRRYCYPSVLADHWVQTAPIMSALD